MDLTLFLRALRARNLRLFFAGQGVSLIGTWVQQAAMSWLTYRLSGSVLLLGVIGFTSQIPSFFFAPLAGVYIDRWDLKRLLIGTQFLSLIQAALLAFFVLTDVVQVWHIVVLSLFLGIINAFDIPARQSFVVKLVEKRDDLGNAIALNSSMVNAARLIGPSIAGLLVAATGEGICFALNAVSYLAVLASLAAMRIPESVAHRERSGIIHELKEGIQYAFGFSPILSILLLVAFVSLTGMPYVVLLPVFARDIFLGDARTYGLLMTSAGIGALAGTIYLAFRKSVLGLDRIIVLTALVFGGGLVSFAMSHDIFFSLCSLALTGFGVMALISSSNALLQSMVDDDKRGRVMSLFVTALTGMTPVGSLLVGVLATMIGVRNTLLVGGFSCMAAGILFARKLPELREKYLTLYAKKGMIQDAT